MSSTGGGEIAPPPKSQAGDLMSAPTAQPMGSSGQVPAPSPGDPVPPSGGHDYPLTLSVDYPDRSLNRLTTAFRIFALMDDRCPSTRRTPFTSTSPTVTPNTTSFAVCRWSSGCWRSPTTSCCSSSQSARCSPPSSPGSRSCSPTATRPSACRPNARRHQGGPKLEPSLGCSSGHDRRRDQGVCGTGLASSEGSEMD